MIFNELNHTQCKTYLVGCEKEKVAIIIDPVQEKIDRYLAMLAYHGLTLSYVTDTHTHADHRSACSELKSLTGSKIIRHQQSPQPNVDIHVDEGDKIKIGELSLNVIHTPGHTPDSISYYVEDRVMTGDVILIGREIPRKNAHAGAGRQAHTPSCLTMPLMFTTAFVAYYP